MRTRVSRWGNSLAIRIPKTYAKRAGLEEGAAVELTARGDSITIRKPEYTLEGLLAGVTPENVHAETDWGPPRGKEIW